MLGRCHVFALFVLVLSFAAVAEDDPIKKNASVLDDRSYGNFWDRIDAVKAIGKVGTKEAVAALAEALADPADPPVREQVVIELGDLKDAEAIQYVANVLLLRHKDPVGRANAAWALRRLRNKETLPALLQALGDPNAVVRANVVEAIGAIGDPSASEKLIGRLADGDANVRAAAILALGRLKDPAAFDAIAKKLNDSAGLVVAACLRALGALDPQKALPLIQEKAKTKLREAKIAAVETIGKIDPPSAVPVGKQLIEDPDWSVRAATVMALIDTWCKEAIDVLVDRLQREKGRLRFDIVMALRQMTGKQIGFAPGDWKAWWDAAREAFEMPERKKGKRGEVTADNPGTQVTFFNVPLLSERMVFIIDFSGSMKTVEDPKEQKEEGPQDTDGKMKIEIALDELEATIHKLSPEVKFTVIMATTETTKLSKDSSTQKLRTISKTLIPATEGNKKTAIKHVRDAWKRLEETKRGRGDYYDAFLEAFEDEEVDTVFLVADGKPTYGQYIDQDNIVEFLGRANEYRKIQIHCVLTGTKGTSPKFMEDVSAMTGGLFVRR